MIALETGRLKIIPLELPQLKLLLAGTPVLEKALGLAASAQELDEPARAAMASLAKSAARAPASYPWMTNWQIILKERNIAVGSACFMAVPDDAGLVEIGYGIPPIFQRRGYMTEALEALCGWALRQPGVGAVAAESEPANTASRRVLKKCGFLPCSDTRSLRVAPQKIHAGTVKAVMKAAGSPVQAAALQRFFKTGQGQYGEGDRFLGLRTPQTRRIAGIFRQLPLSQITVLLANPFHEIRLCALLILVDQYHRSDETRRERILELYLDQSATAINNWDLVDLSAPGIVGIHALAHGNGVIESLADDPLLWRQRIAVVATQTLIRHGEFDETLRLAERFLTHRHDLMHKACGWMLREIGKRNRDVLSGFLQRHRTAMPRTMLRYAIEHYPEAQRRAFLQR